MLLFSVSAQCFNLGKNMNIHCYSFFTLDILHKADSKPLFPVADRKYLWPKLHYLASLDDPVHYYLIHHYLVHHYLVHHYLVHHYPVHHYLVYHYLINRIYSDQSKIHPRSG